MEYRIIIAHRYRELAETMRMMAARAGAGAAQAAFLQAAQEYDRIAFNAMTAGAPESKAEKAA